MLLCCGGQVAWRLPPSDAREDTHPREAADLINNPIAQTRPKYVDSRRVPVGFRPNRGSGGALVDLAGRLVGINTAIFSRSGGSQGIGFAISANMVRAVIENSSSRDWLAKISAFCAKCPIFLARDRAFGGQPPEMSTLLRVLEIHVDATDHLMMPRSCGRVPHRRAFAPTRSTACRRGFPAKIGFACCNISTCFGVASAIPFAAGTASAISGAAPAASDGGVPLLFTFYTNCQRRSFSQITGTLDTPARPSDKVEPRPTLRNATQSAPSAIWRAPFFFSAPKRPRAGGRRGGTYPDAAQPIEISQPQADQAGSFFSPPSSEEFLKTL
jgi:hypothetical protein